MEIHYNGKKYKPSHKDSMVFYMIDSCIEHGALELITKPCKLIDVSPENCKKELLEDVRRCKKTKPEEKPETKYQEAKRKGDIARAKADKLVEKPKYDNTSFAGKVPAEEYDRMMNEIHGVGEEIPEEKPTEEIKTCYGAECPGCEYCYQEKEWWKPNNDKAMEIPLVPEDDTPLDPYNQCVLLTRSLNLVIKKINNL